MTLNILQMDSLSELIYRERKVAEIISYDSGLLKIRNIIIHEIHERRDIPLIIEDVFNKAWYITSLIVSDPIDFWEDWEYFCDIAFSDREECINEETGYPFYKQDIKGACIFSIVKYIVEKRISLPCGEFVVSLINEALSKWGNYPICDSISETTSNAPYIKLEHFQLNDLTLNTYRVQEDDFFRLCTDFNTLTIRSAIKFISTDKKVKFRFIDDLIAHINSNPQFFYLPF